jgi:hypothetical protein
MNVEAGGKGLTRLLNMVFCREESRSDEAEDQEHALTRLHGPTRLLSSARPGSFVRARADPHCPVSAQSLGNPWGQNTILYRLPTSRLHQISAVLDQIISPPNRIRLRAINFRAIASYYIGYLWASLLHWALGQLPWHPL